MPHTMHCSKRICVWATCDCGFPEHAGLATETIGPQNDPNRPPRLVGSADPARLWTGHDDHAARQPLPDLDTLLLDILDAQQQSSEANMRIIKAIENWLTIANLSKDGAE